LADAPVTLSEHVVSQQTFLPTEQAPGVPAVVGRIGRVAAVIAQELAHAALRDRLGYAGGTNVSGDEGKPRNTTSGRQSSSVVATTWRWPSSSTVVAPSRPEAQERNSQWERESKRF
jgi:hypothetical protein